MYAFLLGEILRFLTAMGAQADTAPPHLPPRIRGRRRYRWHAVMRMLYRVLCDLMIRNALGPRLITLTSVRVFGLASPSLREASAWPPRRLTSFRGMPRRPGRVAAGGRGAGAAGDAASCRSSGYSFGSLETWKCEGCRPRSVDDASVQAGVITHSICSRICM